jgi:5-methylcytosine-specific restriction endonuclease McrA
MRQAAAEPADRFEIRFTARGDTVEKLKMAQDLLAHAVPSGDLGEVVDRALTALAEQLLRTKFAVTASPRKQAGSPSTASRPAAVRRAVYLRDRGRCTFVSKEGRRCDSRRYLQFDHVDGRAVGGAFTVERVRLRCGPHNRLEAERLYGTPPRARDAGGARVTLTTGSSPIRPGTGERGDGARRGDGAASAPHVPVQSVASG